MGFKEMPAGTKIEAVFNLVSIYSIEGIALNDLHPDSFSDVSCKNKDFSFAFGNSVNEISNELLGDDFVKVCIRPTASCRDELFCVKAYDHS